MSPADPLAPSTATIEALRALIAQLRSREVSCEWIQSRGDVACVALPDGWEAVNETGTYDLWYRGQPRAFGLSLEDATTRLARKR